MIARHITIPELKSLLSYDPDTGVLRWVAPGKGRIKKKPAGTVEQSGYIGVLIYGKRIRAHILGWAIHHGQWPENQIDHVNGIKTDNRLTNLREATNSQNGKNLPIKKNNKSGYPGVIFRSGKWRVQIKVNFKYIGLGTYSDFNEAVSVKKEAEYKYFGEWRRHK